MPVTKRPYQDALYQGINIFRDTMRLFIVNRLQSTPGVSETTSIANSLTEDMAEQFWKDLAARKDVGEAIDINIFGQIIQHNWKLTFENVFDDALDSVRNHFDAIRQARNLTFHPLNQDIPKPQAESALRSMARILAKIGYYDESVAIDAIREGSSAPGPKHVQPGNDSPGEIARLVAAQLLPLVAIQRIDAGEAGTGGAIGGGGKSVAQRLQQAGAAGSGGAAVHAA